MFIPFIQFKKSERFRAFIPLLCILNTIVHKNKSLCKLHEYIFEKILDTPLMEFPIRIRTMRFKFILNYLNVPVLQLGDFYNYKFCE